MNCGELLASLLPAKLPFDKCLLIAASCTGGCDAAGFGLGSLGSFLELIKDLGLVKKYRCGAAENVEREEDKVSDAGELVYGKERNKRGQHRYSEQSVGYLADGTVFHLHGERE